MRLSAAAGTTVLAYQAALLIDECLLTAIRTLLPLGLSTIHNIFLKRTLHTVLPSIDALALELQRADELNYMVDGHAVAEHS